MLAVWSETFENTSCCEFILFFRDEKKDSHRESKRTLAGIFTQTISKDGFQMNNNKELYY